MFKVIDLFSGCGGFSIGFKKAGFTITKAVEFDSEIAKSYAHNHKETIMINKDIKDIDNAENFSLNEADIIIGGPPCQGFSMAGVRNRTGFIDDERNYLFKHYFNIVKLVKPKVFIMENVKGILSMKSGAIFKEILNIFSNEENFGGDRYFLHHIIVNSQDYGIPQNRERVIIIGVKNNDFNLETFISHTRKIIDSMDNTYFNKVNIRQALGNLPLPSENGECEELEVNNHYERYLASENRKTYNHIATKHSKKAIERMEKIKENENFKILDEDINSIHSGSYGRLSYNGIAPTITTRFDTPSGGRFIHPEYNRTITPREAARIQSFPDDFEFLGSKSSICKQIGNAVPVKISYFYAVLVRGILDEFFIG